jgi:hypothetical protein
LSYWSKSKVDQIKVKVAKSKVDQVKAIMIYSMKLENKLKGDSNFRAWKTRIDLILAKNKVLDIVKGKIAEPQFEEGKRRNLITLQLWRISRTMTSIP